MEEYLAGNYHDCIQKYEQLLLQESDQATPEELAMIHCNISAAEFGKKSLPTPHPPECPLWCQRLTDSVLISTLTHSLYL